MRREARLISLHLFLLVSLVSIPNYYALTASISSSTCKVGGFGEICNRRGELREKMTIDLTEDSPEKRISVGARGGNLRGGGGSVSGEGDAEGEARSERVPFQQFEKAPKRTLAFSGSGSASTADTKRLKGAAQRPAGGASGGVPSADKKWVFVSGDDCKDEFQDDVKWSEMVCTHNSRTPWEDEDFPAAKESIDGPPEKEKSAPAGEQLCRCGLAAKKSVVGKETPNKGRPYFNCAMRKCGFFNWADNKRSSWKHYDWKRFPSFVIVSDFGFSAEHLRQGGVGGM